MSANVDLDAEVTSKTIIAELAGAYQIARWAGGTPGSGTAVDVYGGGRLWWQQADVKSRAQCAASGDLAEAHLHGQR